MTVKELKKELKKLGISFSQYALKPDLEKLFSDAMKEVEPARVTVEEQPEEEQVVEEEADTELGEAFTAPRKEPELPIGTNSKPMKVNRFTGQPENDYSE